MNKHVVICAAFAAFTESVFCASVSEIWDSENDLEIVKFDMQRARKLVFSSS